MRPLQEFPWSQNNFAEARKWLQECLDKHESCRQRLAMPTRVVQLLLKRGQIRVRDTSDSPPQPYAALSYCWGAIHQNRLRATRDTLPEMRRGVDVTRLPQTLQDAIRVAGDLGFEYLWVDALCIVQDDDEEKASEMARMSEVYEGATLTISASRAAHCDGGLLHRRDLKAHYVELYELPWGDGERSLGTETVLCSEIGYFRCESDPIDLRAWTLQEHRLSRRLLRFGSSQLVWRCMVTTLVDGGPAELSPSSSAVSYPSPIEHPSDWKNIVERYTSRHISMWQDRLPAIAALAEKYRRYGLGFSRPNGYLAGLWREHLHSMLLWYIPTAEQRVTCLPPADRGFVSPTWSWHLASGGVKYTETWRMNFSLHVHAADVALVSPGAPFGMVTEGRIVAEGLLWKVSWTGSSFEWDHRVAGTYLRSVDPRWDLPTNAVREVFYLLEVGFNTPAESTGLIVKEVASSPPKFRRVGYYEANVHRGRDGWREAVPTHSLTLI